MRKEQTFKVLSLAFMSVVVACCCSVSLVSCTSDDSGASSSFMKTNPLRFALSFDGYEDTRGYVSNDMDESVGLFAYLFEDWGTTGPNFMFDEEMQFNGTYWQTVNTFDQPDPGYLMRFYAYYPFGISDALEFSAPEAQGAPDFTYTVPKELEEQVDLMAGRSVGDIASQDLRKASEITIKMSHLLTAIKFQVGKCSENGRITKITLKKVLDKNNYHLSETEEYVEDPANPSTFLTDPLTE